MRWKLSALHLGRRNPKDLTVPRTWLTSLVLVPTSASREWSKAKGLRVGLPAVLDPKIRLGHP